MNGSGSEDSTLVKIGTRPQNGWHVEDLQCVKLDTTSVEDGKIAVITLSKPEQRNAWTEIMRNEISYCIEHVSRMKKVRAIIITGDPAGKAFCAGASLAPSGPHNPTSVDGDVPEGRPANNSYWRDGGGQASLSIVRSTKPVIAAVNGAAVGVGMTLPLACDLTVAAEDAKVGFVFGKRGLTMEACSSYFLERCVGHKIAMELVLTGRVFKAKDAPPGLFNYTVPQDKVMEKAISLAKEMFETSPMSNMINRNMIIRNGHNTSPEEAHLVESRSIHWVMQQADAKEGIKSFLEKRKPEFPLDPFKDVPEWFPWWREVSTKSRL